MQVISGCVSGTAHGCNLLTTCDLLTDLNLYAATVGIQSLHPVAMINHKMETVVPPELLTLTTVPLSAA